MAKTVSVRVNISAAVMKALRQLVRKIDAAEAQERRRRQRQRKA